MTTVLDDLNDTILADVLLYYAMTRRLPDGRVCGVMKLLFHWTVHIDLTPWGYEDRYCFRTFADAVHSMESWDGNGDLPGNWHRHPATGRRRDVASGKEWIEP